MDENLLKDYFFIQEDVLVDEERNQWNPVTDVARIDCTNSLIRIPYNKGRGVNNPNIFLFSVWFAATDTQRKQHFQRAKARGLIVRVCERKPITFKDCSWNTTSNEHKHSHSFDPWKLWTTGSTCSGLQTAVDHLETGENVMSTTTTTNTETTRYLESRLYDVYSDKKVELRKKFRLDMDNAPKSIRELIDRLNSGRYKLVNTDDYSPEWTIDTQLGDDDFLSIWSKIDWTTDDLKPDRAGYKAVLAKADADFLSTKDIIRIKTPSEGLDALNSFKLRTYH